MHDEIKIAPTLIVPTGTQVVLRLDMLKCGSSDLYPKGTIAEIVAPPADGGLIYGVRCPDGG